MNCVINVAARRWILNTVEGCLDVLRSGTVLTTDSALANTIYKDFLPQMPRDTLIERIPDVKSKSLPINLKGSLGWKCRINDMRRVAEGHSLVGLDRLTLTGCDVQAVQIATITPLGDKKAEYSSSSRQNV